MRKLNYENLTACPVKQTGERKVDESMLNFKWALTEKNFDAMKRRLDSNSFIDGECFGHVYFGAFCVDVQFVDYNDRYITLIYYKLDPDADYGETVDGDNYDCVDETYIMFKDFPATYEDFKETVEKIIKSDLENRELLLECKETDIYKDVPMW